MELRQRGAGGPAVEPDEATNGDIPASDRPPSAAPAPSSLGKGRRDGRCVRFLMSRSFKGFTFTVVAVVPVFGALVALPRVLELQDCSTVLCRVRHYAWAVWVSVQFLFNFAMSQWVDAGGCLQVKPQHEVTGQFELRLPRPSSEDALDREEDIMLYAPNWCEHCQHWKPPRSHHCSFCRRCTQRMDHHCPFTGNCIGMRNHGHFCLMYIFAILGVSYSLVMCGWSILRSPTPKGLAGRIPSMLSGLTGLVAHFVMKAFMTAGPVVALQALLTSVAFVAVISFGMPAMWMVLTGATLLENSFPMKEYVQIKPQVYCPLGPGFYRQRWWQNLRDVLGPRWWLRLLVPTRGGPQDPRLGTSPLASPEGAAALLQRMKQVEEQGVAREVKSCQELGLNPGPAESSTVAHSV